MLLSDIVKGIGECKVVQGVTTILIDGVQTDSREVERGDLFIATRGVAIDSHNFISGAIERGAVAVVCEKVPAELQDGVTYITVADSGSKVGVMASNFYNNPSQKITIVGVTGTNGKTTIATLLYRLLREMGISTGLLSTIENIVNDRIIPATHTTPDPISLQRLLSEMVSEGVEYVFMEVSSHALDQQRVSGLEFNGAIFTNLTHDHLDYHKTFLHYLNSKKRLFDGLPKDAFALVNSDDKNGTVMLQNCLAKKQHRFSIKGVADYTGKIIERHADGMLLEFDRQEIWSRFIGDFNASNLLAVFSTALLLGFERGEVMRCLSMLAPVSGRFETIVSESGKIAIIDYAHTPDALKNVLESIQSFKRDTQEVITVVGAGGDRDRSKRPEMTQEASKGSDRVILTADNPRSEDPEEIIREMKSGLSSSILSKIISIVDRREAIKTAIALAKSGDIVLIAGKGHENYQDIKGVKHHFDDKEEVQNIYNEVEKKSI